MTGGKDRIPGITALRGLAAVLVVIAHALMFGALLRGLPNDTAEVLPFGSVGVLIFFAISGYVIGLQRHIPPLEFMIRRAIRIYPPFWIACMLAFAGISMTGGAVLIADARMLSLLPTVHIVDNSIPYWTLLFEVAFYAAAVVAFSLRLSDRALSLVTLAWVGAILLSLGRFSASPTPPPGLYITAMPGALLLLSPYCLFFAAGLLVCLHEKRLLPISAPALIVVGASIAALANTMSPISIYYWLSPEPACLLWAAAAGVLIHLVTRLRSAPGIALMLGNASYGLYLLHLLVMRVIVLTAGDALARFQYLPYLVAFIIPLTAGMAFGLFEFRLHAWLLSRVRGAFIGSHALRQSIPSLQASP